MVNMHELFFKIQKRYYNITNVFQKTFDESGHKPNEIRVGKGSELYKIIVKKYIQHIMK